jgi:hypothetical protein
MVYKKTLILYELNVLMIYGENVNDNWKNNESDIWLFTDDCIINMKIMNNSEIDKLQTGLNQLGEWVVENKMNIYPGKNKAVRFTKARVKEWIRYCYGDQLILEESSFKYLGIIICRHDNRKSSILWEIRHRYFWVS